MERQRRDQRQGEERDLGTNLGDAVRRPEAQEVAVAPETAEIPFGKGNAVSEEPGGDRARRPFVDHEQAAPN
jgi:hypothetical protein